MYKKILLFVAMSFLSLAVAFGAVINVASDSVNVLPTAIDNAGPDDIIVLTDLGPYLSTQQIALDTNTTIVGDPALLGRPVLKYTGTSTSAYMFKIEGDHRLALANLEFDGDGTSDGAAALAKYVVRIDNADTTMKAGLFMDNCVAHDFNDKFIKPYGNAGMDSLVVTNSMFYNGASEGIVLYSGSSSDPAAIIEYAEVSNCTFAHIEREAIKGQTGTKTKVLVNRCTLFDIGAVENKAMIYINDMTDVVVKNSIFASNNNLDAEKFADFETPEAQFHNNVVWETTNYEVDYATVFDTMHVDPMFADPANLDFTLPESSALLSYADDGGAIGDTRWVPEASAPTVHYVAAGTDVISAAYTVAAEGDIIELISSGGIYNESVYLNIEKSITIRGAFLAEKPVIRCAQSSEAIFRLTAPDARLEINNVEIDGTDGAGTNVSKYFVRIDNADTTGTAKLIVKNAVIHDFTDKHIKPYPLSGVDSIVVDNSILYGGASEGVTLYSGTSSDPAAYIKGASFTNSTFYGFEREAIKGQTYTETNVVIDRCTFYDLGEVDKKAMLYFRNMEDVEVKNSIFAKNNNADAEKFADFASSVSLFHHNVVWETTNYEVGAATVSDTLHVDPMFADAANADFSIPESSPLMSFADDGGAIGDPRWAPTGGTVLLNIFVDGGGSVTLDPAGGVYEPGTSVTMTATADSLYVFDHWSDNVAIFPPNNPVATVTVNENMNVTAYFIPTINEFTVTFDVLGLGHIVENHIAHFPVEGYWEGDTLELTAVSDSPTWTFVKWTDAAGTEVSTDNPLVYPVTADAHFTAVFNSTLPQVSLDLTIVGLGDVTVDPLPVPGFDTYDQNQAVTLEAEAAVGWIFSGYSGDVTSAADSLSVTLDANKAITATFSEMPVPGGDLLVDASWDLRDAIEFAKYNSNVKRIVLTETGPYMPDESLRNEGKLPNLNIDTTITIVASDTLSEKPVVKAWGEGGSEGLFRLRTNGHLSLQGLVLDGYTESGNPTKYIVRADDGQEMHVSFVAEDCDMLGTVEAFWKNYPMSTVDSLILRNCNVSDIGKEGIFLNSVGDAEYIGLFNSTFRHVGRQIIYLRSMDPKIVVDHVSIDSCGLGYGSEGAKFPAFRIENTTDVKVTNTIIANIPFDAADYTPYAIRIAGENSLMSNVLFFNAPEKLDLQDGAVLGNDVYFYDPMFVRSTPEDLTLADNSVAYHLAGDGTAAIGDLRWATSTSVADLKALNVASNGHGTVALLPEPMAKFYAPGTLVTLTAEADTLYKFGSWSGDLSGTSNPETLTMNADKSVMVTFDKAFFTVNMNVNMSVWADKSKFSVGVDSVDIAGNMNGWGADPMWMKDADGDTVHSYTLIVDENYPNLEWKFRINGSWNDATAEFPYGGPARTLTLVSDTSVTYWYNDEEPEVGVMDIPEEYVLNQNYPNPFNPTTTINFGLPRAEYTTVKLFDLTGRQVMTLIETEMAAGYHDVILNALQLPSGIYFYSIKAGEFTSVKKMTLLK